MGTCTEGKRLSRLHDLMRGHTALTVAHCISKVKDADLICGLEEGRIIERAHDALLRLVALTQT